MNEIVLTVRQLHDIIVDAIDAAFEKYKLSHTPEGGLVKRQQAIRYLVRNGFKPSDLTTAERDGLIHRARPQKAKGHAIWYRYEDVKSLVASYKATKRVYGRDEAVGREE